MSSGKLLLQRGFSNDHHHEEKEKKKSHASRASIELPPGLENLLMPLPPVPPVSHRFGKRKLNKRRQSVVVTTSMGKLIAEIPSSPYDKPPAISEKSFEEEEMEEEKKEDRVGSKALARFRKFCSTGDLVVRFRFTGTDLSNDLVEKLRFDILELVGKRSIYRSEYVVFAFPFSSCIYTSL